jgi:hypothetical protein
VQKILLVRHLKSQPQLLDPSFSVTIIASRLSRSCSSFDHLGAAALYSAEFP